MTDVLVVAGTRPELVKLVSVVEALRQQQLSVAVVLTGQHTTLLDPALIARLGVTASLGIASQDSMLKFMTAARPRLAALLREVRPRCVLVQGDTASAMVGALGAHDAGVPIAHVEAGLRSGDMREPWPEEHIRTSIDRLATWRYAPTANAAHNLTTLDGLDSVVTGNTSIDVLVESGVRPRTEALPPLLLVTLHRREFRERGDALHVLQALAAAIAAAPLNAVWPVHPGMAPLAAQLAVPANFSLRPPLAYHNMLATLAEARGLLTDSGGLVEEAAHLGIPTAIVRNANDRPEAVVAGIARRFPVTVDGVTEAVRTLASRAIPREPTRAYGDGGAGVRIAAHLAAQLAARASQNDTLAPDAGA